jgi:hypothetical protein
MFRGYNREHSHVLLERAVMRFFFYALTVAAAATVRA